MNQKANCSIRPVVSAAMTYSALQLGKLLEGFVKRSLQSEVCAFSMLKVLLDVSSSWGCRCHSHCLELYGRKFEVGQHNLHLSSLSTERLKHD